MFDNGWYSLIRNGPMEVLKDEVGVIMPLKAGDSYQGVEVMAVDVARAEHPRARVMPEDWEHRYMVVNDVTLLLLADETTVVVCDTCDFNGITGSAPYVKPVGVYRSDTVQAKSVGSHRNTTHDRLIPPHSFYTDETVRAAIKVYLKWKGTHLQNWATFAANEMNRLGFRPHRGSLWTASALGSLVNNRKKKKEFSGVGAGPLTAEELELSELLQEAAARESGNVRNNTVGNNARITTAPAQRRGPAYYENLLTGTRAAAEAEPRQEKVVSSQGQRNTSGLSFVTAAQAASEAAPVAPKPTTTQEAALTFLGQTADGTDLYSWGGRLVTIHLVKGLQH